MTLSRSPFRVSRDWREKRARSACPDGSGAGVLAREAHRQDLAALFAAAAEYCASPLGFHARAESVRSNAALVSGTIRGLTHLELQFRKHVTSGAKRARKGKREGWEWGWGNGNGGWGMGMGMRMGLGVRVRSNGWGRPDPFPIPHPHSHLPSAGAGRIPYPFRIPIPISHPPIPFPPIPFELHFAPVASSFASP
jgi:hypothetical protein